MKRSLAYALMTVLLTFLAACSSDGNGNGTDAGDGDAGNQVKCAGVTCLRGELCVNETICVPEASMPAEACQEHEDEEKGYISIGPADLTCHNIEPCSTADDCIGDQQDCFDGFCGIVTPTGDLPTTVTFRGCVDAFGIGDTPHTIRVALYQGNRDPSTDPPLADVATTEDRTGCEYWGEFEFTDVPTNTPLILKSYDEQGFFTVTYKYGLILWADLATDEGGGNFVFDTRDTVQDPRTGGEISLNAWRGYAISQTTYSVILLAVGYRELPPGSGAVAGTARDCLYREMENVSCGLVDKPQVLTFFTNTGNPRPDSGRIGTNKNGIYAAIDLPEGSHRLSCLAEDEDGNQVPLGEYDVQIFEHAITILSFDWYPGL
jgi:hypothetical protein